MIKPYICKPFFPKSRLLGVDSNVMQNTHMRIKVIYKRLIPTSLRRFLSRFFYSIHWRLWPLKSYFLLKKLARKEKVNVLLLMYNVDAWKLHCLYQEFEKEKRFTPLVVICPIMTRDNDFLIEKMRDAEKFCRTNKYNYYLAYDFDNSQVIDVRAKLSCDIVFFTNPNLLSGESLYIDNFDDCLTCYVPYSFRIDRLFEYEYNNRTANKAWKCFYETELHKLLAEKHADNKGSNVIVFGFPHLDSLKPGKVDVSDGRKLIIWAPHWTIKGAQNTGLDWSCFLEYSEFILALAEKYREKVRFVMKPHPFLFDTLRQHKVWGKEKTDEYLRRWEDAENCRIETGDYVSLFFESDALIHDSGSFMTEYLLQNKPMAYTLNDVPLGGRFNAWGEVAIACHELITSMNDFELFIKRVICEKDVKKCYRSRIINKNLRRNNGVAPEIVKYLLKVTSKN